MRGKRWTNLFWLWDNHIHNSPTHWAKSADSTNRISSATATHERTAHFTFIQSISLGIMINGDVREIQLFLMQAAHHTEPVILSPPAIIPGEGELELSFVKFAWTSKHSPSHWDHHLLYERYLRVFLPS